MTATNVTLYEEYSSEDEKVHTTSLYFVLVAGMLAGVLVLSKKLHERPAINSFISEAALVLMVGMLTGAVVSVCMSSSTTTHEENGQYTTLAHSLLSFSPNVFFMALLPPIIFNSGYQLRRELFYRHIRPITNFACFGTTISACCTGLILYATNRAGWMGGSGSNSVIFAPTIMEFLTFGALISATDTVSIVAIFQAKRVDPHLYYLVFGESALNDAVALVLFNAFSDFLKSDFNDAGSIMLRMGGFLLEMAVQAIASPVLGMSFGCATALLFKMVDFREYKHLELPLYLLMMYVPFLAAECLYLSGIVAIFFSGISARRYIVPNVTETTKKNAETFFKLASYLSETCIFLELGLSIWGLPVRFNWLFILWAFLASLVSRAIGIYPLSFLYNFSLKEITVTPAATSELVHVEVTKLDGLLRVQSCDSSVSTSSSTIRRTTPKKRIDKHISLSMTHVLWFAGLRGAVAYACVRDFPNLYGHADDFTAATMVIVLISIIVMGGATESLLRTLDIDMGIDEDEYMKDWHTKRQLKGWFHRYEYNYIYKTVVRNLGHTRCGSDDCSDTLTLCSIFDYHVQLEDVQQLQTELKVPPTIEQPSNI